MATLNLWRFLLICFQFLCVFLDLTKTSYSYFKNIFNLSCANLGRQRMWKIMKCRRFASVFHTMAPLNRMLWLHAHRVWPPTSRVIIKPPSRWCNRSDAILAASAREIREIEALWSPFRRPTLDSNSLDGFCGASKAEAQAARQLNYPCRLSRDWHHTLSH